MWILCLMAGDYQILSAFFRYIDIERSLNEDQGYDGLEKLSSVIQGRGH